MARRNTITAEEQSSPLPSGSEPQVTKESLTRLISQTPRRTLISVRRNPQTHDRLRAELHNARLPGKFTEDLMHSLTDITDNPNIDVLGHLCHEKNGVPLMDVIISQKDVFFSIYSKVLAKYLVKSLRL
jgi:hypothetical protein